MARALLPIQSKTISILTLIPLLCFLLLLSVNSIEVTDPSLPIISSLGVFYEVEDGQLLYESTAPLVYTVRLPNWLNFLILPEKAQNCSDTEACEIFAALRILTDQIRSSLQTTPFTFPSVTEDSTWDLRCNHISKHFSSSFITPAIVQKYMGFLRSCSDGIILEESLIDDFTRFPDATEFRNLDHLWTSHFFSKFNETSSSENMKILLDAGEAGEVESILSLGVTNYLAEAIRWNMAFAKCGSGHIPDSIITPEKFYESLKKLNTTAINSGYRLVIPPLEQFLPVYFKSEYLTDCSISLSPSTENGSGSSHMDLIVRTLVPIIRTNSEWKHVSIKSFQFVENATKLIFYPEFPSIFHQENSRFIYDNSSKALYTSDTKLCDPTKPGFCRVPEIWDSRRVIKTNCPMELLSGKLHLNNASECNRKLLVDAIEFPGLPFIVKEGTHTLYLTGIRDESESFDISVSCNKKEETYYYQFPIQGALKIQLPCECKLLVRKLNAVIKPELGCSSTLNVVVVLPA